MRLHIPSASWGVFTASLAASAWNLSEKGRRGGRRAPSPPPPFSCTTREASSRISERAVCGRSCCPPPAFLIPWNKNTLNHGHNGTRLKPKFKRFVFPSRIHIKEFNPKKWFLSSRKYDPGCSFRIPDPQFLCIPDPGSRGQKGTGSRIRIRNTACDKKDSTDETTVTHWLICLAKFFWHLFGSEVLRGFSTVLLEDFT